MIKMAEEHTHWRQPTPTAEEALASWRELKDQLRGSILTDAVAHALVTCADTVIEIVGGSEMTAELERYVDRWTRLRASIQADLDKVMAGDLTTGTNYALADALRGALAKMDALEPGGAWAQPVRLADYACGVPTGGDSTCRRVI